MRKEKGERAGALMSRMVISPFSFLRYPLIPRCGLDLLLARHSANKFALCSCFVRRFSFLLPVRSTATVSLCPPIYNS